MTMYKPNLVAAIILLTTISLITPAEPLFSQDDELIDNFEGADFMAHWWVDTDGATFSCTPAMPGNASDNALQLTFAANAGQYPVCGMDVSGAEQWAVADGLRFAWRSDSPDLVISVVLELVDPSQTNPDANGLTPFEAYLQAPTTDWAVVTVPWEAFSKAEWVGESGTSMLDVSQVIDLVFQVDESQTGTLWIDDLGLMSTPTLDAGADFDKFTLWTSGTQLRGANIWQRVVVPAIDGDEFLGSGHVGPPYGQADFDRLALLGANYVNISGPGLFTERPPYILDEALQANLDGLLQMIANANMFAVISFRTGPGRSDFTFYDEGIEEWGDPALVIDDVWLDQSIQDAWVEMWRYTAERYRDNPVVVGYDLMVEPNAAGRLLDIYEPDDFYPDYADTLYDWNQFYPRIVDAMREVDTETPILVSGMGWGAVRWLPYLEPIADTRTVYMVHQYEPQDAYTHQEPSGTNTYPGEFDVDDDGETDLFDRQWLDDYLRVIDDFRIEHNVPVAVNEFGLVRWVPNGADYMRDLMDWFEQRGLNHALWMFNPSWLPQTAENDDFDFLHGADPDNHTNVETSDLIEVITSYWARNTIRP